MNTLVWHVTSALKAFSTKDSQSERLESFEGVEAAAEKKMPYFVFLVSGT